VKTISESWDFKTGTGSSSVVATPNQLQPPKNGREQPTPCSGMIGPGEPNTRTSGEDRARTDVNKARPRGCSVFVPELGAFKLCGYWQRTAVCGRQAHRLSELA